MSALEQILDKQIRWLSKKTQLKEMQYVTSISHTDYTA